MGFPQGCRFFILRVFALLQQVGSIHESTAVKAIYRHLSGDGSVIDVLCVDFYLGMLHIGKIDFRQIYFIIENILWQCFLIYPIGAIYLS